MPNDGAIGAPPTEGGTEKKEIGALYEGCGIDPHLH
jgi:hypothetical protein